MFRIRDLAAQAIEATSDDPKGNMLGFGPIYKLLDTEGSRNPHLKAIGRTASREPTAFHTVASSPKKPTRLRAKSPPGVPRAVAPPILATAKAACSKPQESSSRPTP
jgi:hypothetical protein